MSDRATTPRAPPDAGFTLIEMIVALALMSLIVGLLASSVRGTRQVLAFIDRNNVTGAVPPAQSYLLSSFAQTVSAQQAGADRPPALLGEPARVRFTTSHAPQGQIEGLYHSAAATGYRRHQCHSRSAGPMGRAVIGSPARKRRKSAANCAAV